MARATPSHAHVPQARGASPAESLDRAPLEPVDSTRVRILRAAAHQIADEGVASVRMAGIAREAGVSQALLHYHFETKDQLLEEVLRFSYEQSGTGVDVARLYARPLTAEQRLAAWLDSCLPASDELRRDLLLWQEFDALGPRLPVAARVTSSLFAQDVELVVRFIEEGVVEGTFTVADPPRAARAIVALCVGLCSRVLSDDPEIPLTEARDVVATAAATLLGSARPLPLSTRPQSSRRRSTARDSSSRPNPSAPRPRTLAREARP